MLPLSIFLYHHLLLFRVQAHAGCHLKHEPAGFIMVGYTLPKKHCEKIFLSSLRIYASIDNAWTWCAKDFRGYDPESGLSAIQTSNYPVPINYSLGINVGF